ncbi:hypothetical protein BT69DRAFT_1339447 [Atractiella rhizophila]|nr:hypothetical protein BT69DRAFT_1339447 [Atractiella rhizophila]
MRLRRRPVYILSDPGFSLDLLPTTCSLKFTQVSQQNSAEVIALNNGMRYLFSAVASAAILPLVKAVGVGPANAMSAGMGWIGCGLVVLVLRYGRRMRNWIDGKKEGMEQETMQQISEGHVEDSNA